MKKAVVVHAGRRDGYHIAAGLHAEDLLEALVTDVYFEHPSRSAGVRAFCTAGIPVEKRTSVNIPSDHVVCSASAAFWGATEKAFPRQNALQRLKARALSRKALSVALETDSTFFTYSTTGSWAFPLLAKMGVPRLLFQMHPDPRSLARLYQEEIERVPQAAMSLLSEMEMQASPSELEELNSEATLATSIAVASTFTKSSLIEQGVNPLKITVIPYGVDCTKFRSLEARPRLHGALRLVFVGSLIQRKGLSYLLEAVSKFKTGRVHLTLVTRDFEDHKLLSSYPSDNIEIKRNLSHESLLSVFHDSDLFVLPSIAEGFGQVIVEAMATGLPVIASQNTAAMDIVTHGYDGWIVAPRSTSEIVRILEEALSNRAGLRDMGMRAALVARELTWEKFHARIVEFYRTAVSGTNYSEININHARPKQNLAEKAGSVGAN